MKTPFRFLTGADAGGAISEGPSRRRATMLLFGSEIKAIARSLRARCRGWDESEGGSRAFRLRPPCR
jgi:hypothetical protein